MTLSYTKASHWTTRVLDFHLMTLHLLVVELGKDKLIQSQGFATMYQSFVACFILNSPPQRKSSPQLSSRDFIITQSWELHTFNLYFLLFSRYHIFNSQFYLAFLLNSSIFHQLDPGVCLSARFICQQAVSLKGYLSDIIFSYFDLKRESCWFQ